MAANSKKIAAWNSKLSLLLRRKLDTCNWRERHIQRLCWLGLKWRYFKAALSPYRQESTKWQILLYRLFLCELLHMVSIPRVERLRKWLWTYVAVTQNSFYTNLQHIVIFSDILCIKLTPWLMKPGRYMPDSQAPSNYFELNQSNSPNWHISLRLILILFSHLRLGLPQNTIFVGSLVTANILATSAVHLRLLDLIKILKNNKSVAYSSQGSHTGQLDFCNWLADGSTTG